MGHLEIWWSLGKVWNEIFMKSPIFQASDSPPALVSCSSIGTIKLSWKSRFAVSRNFDLILKIVWIYVSITAPTLKGDLMGTQFWVKWGPNEDPRQQKWGPKNRIFQNWPKQANSLKKQVFFKQKNIHRDRVCPHLVHSVCAIYIE